MNSNDILQSLPSYSPYIPWLLGGAWIGDRLVTLARSIPEQVLRQAEAPSLNGRVRAVDSRNPFHPAGGCGYRVSTQPLGVCSHTAGGEAIWGALLWACLASSLLLLALTDWDTTMLPDRVVLPLGLAGLGASYAGLTQQSLIGSAASSAVMLGLLGGIGWVYKSIKGESGMGGGDLKLLAALAAWWGVLGVLYVVAGAGIVTVVWYVVWRQFKNFSRKPNGRLAPPLSWQHSYGPVE